MVPDIICILLILLFFIRGYSRGFIVAAFSVIALLLGVICALKLSHSFAAWLLAKGYVTSGWVQVVSYVVLFIGVVMVVRLIAKLLQKAAEGLMLGMINSLIGGLLYAFLGAVLWSSLLWIGIRMQIFTPQTLAASKTSEPLSHLAPWFFEQAGHLLPFAKDTFTDLQHFFDTIGQKTSGSVGTH